ncbi:MAG: hypothetical protein AB1465_01400 [Patescibacteria group bacterium]
MRTKAIIALITLFSFVSFVSCGTIKSSVRETRTVYGYQQKVDDKNKVTASENIGEIGKESIERIEEKEREIPWWVGVVVVIGLGVAGAAAGAAAAAGGGGAAASATIVIPK